MYTNIFSLFSRRNSRVLALGIGCIVSSFAIGIQSVGDVQPVTLIEAGNIQQAGDVDGSGEVDIRDAIVILEIVQGYASATPQQLKADPNGDGTLTVDDALRILSTVPLR
ncbi:MAG: dockerin type I repeat-containing protein [Candidatus Peribacteraceae bacterium]